MRKYSVILLWVIVAICLSGCSVFSNHKAELRYGENLGAKEVWKVGNFESIFSKYWGLRFSENTESAFQMEAPYFQEMISRKRYENYIKGAQKNELLFIQIDKVVQETQGLYKVFAKMNLKMSEDGSVRDFDMVDSWVLVQNKWYHVLKDYLIFPEISQ